jgi:peptidoglycan/LPS O-acetylase OafA/YrhL
MRNKSGILDKRIPELDGLRGVAALLVLIAHYFGYVPHGTKMVAFDWLGVDLFFVLSGFLIGSIILAEHAQPNFFASFYLRRAARIVPVYGIVCAAALALSHLLAGHAWSDQPYSPIVYAGFVSNVALSFGGGGGEWLRPTWTLAVEEQFYILLPLLIVVTPKRWLDPLLVVLWLGATVFRAAVVQDNVVAAFVLLPARMDLLLGGVLIARLRQEVDLSRFLGVLRIIPPIALMLCGTLYAAEGLFIIFSPALVSIAGGAFILALAQGAPEGARLRMPLLRYFGRISYTFYLVHIPVAGMLHGLILDARPDINGVAPVAVTVLSIAVSIGLAAASWTWIERPILDYARAYRARMLAPAVASS